MPAKKFLLSMVLSVLAAPAVLPAQDFTEIVKATPSKPGATSLSVPGAEPGWFFLRRELEHLAVGDLAAADLATANTEGTDPVPVIAAYAAELKALGVELLLVPIPPKAAIYPEKLDPGVDPATVPSLAPFYEKLKAAGAPVLDLETVFKKARAEKPDQQLYCATDSHWSPHAAQLVAKIISRRYQNVPGMIPAPVANLKTLPEEVLEFHGDLLDDTQKASLPKEQLPLVRAGTAGADGATVTTVEGDPASPVIVLGDSHLQVFRKGGNMLATQSGFIDHLQVGLGGAVDEYSMQAGGADGPRVNIARASAKDTGFWTNKKLVIWLFTAREFTQGKWRVLPAQVRK